MPRACARPEGGGGRGECERSSTPRARLDPWFFFSIGTCRSLSTRTVRLTLPPPGSPSLPSQYPLLGPADGAAPIAGAAAILAALGAPASPGADQWFDLAAAAAGPCASLVEPLAGERPAKDGEEAAAAAELNR